MWAFGCKELGKTGRLGDHELLSQRPAMFEVRAETVMATFGATGEDGKKQNVCMDGTPEELH